jgi:hypothetical protein
MSPPRRLEPNKARMRSGTRFGLTASTEVPAAADRRRLADISVLILGEAHNPHDRRQLALIYELIVSALLFLTADRRGHLPVRREDWQFVVEWRTGQLSSHAAFDRHSKNAARLGWQTGNCQDATITRPRNSLRDSALLASPRRNGAHSKSHIRGQPVDPAAKGDVSFIG